MTEEFKLLTDREHVIARVGVYLGSATLEEHSGVIGYKYKTVKIVPALLKMVEEIYQNSVDEAIRTNFEYANEIKVDISSGVDGTTITVQDNGRGIPVDQVAGRPRPVVAWTELRAGSNFDDSKRIGAGANGMGSALTNIFSTYFRGETSDGSKKVDLVCTNNMSDIKFSVKDSSARGTKVTFIPDLEKFNLTEFTEDHIEVIKDRLSNLAISFPSITFKFNGEKIQFKNTKTVAKNFCEQAVTAESEFFSLVFAPSGEDEEFRCLTYVNGIYIKNGGSHLDYVTNKIIENLRAHVKKKHKIEVLPNQIRQHLLVGMWCRSFPAPRFDSQSKERITNSVAEVSSYLGDLNFDKIAKQILSTPEIIDPMIQAILFKKERAEAAEAARLAKNAKKIRVANHIAAQSKNPEEKMLVVAEGLSAIGMLLNVRDPKTMGGYPLRGKVMNVYGMKPVEILKNKELNELCSVLGLEIGKPADNLNYGTIALMLDSDYDGDSIRALLLNFFRLWPELFVQGRVRQIMTPLYTATKGKQELWFYTHEEFEKADTSGFVIKYFKGLGTMSKDMYRKVLAEPKFVTFKNTDDFASLDMAFGPDTNKRKEWMMTSGVQE